MSSALNKLNTYRGAYFESSSGETPAFKSFSRTSKSALKKMAEENSWTLESFNKGHFEWSAFIKNPTNNKFAYVSIFDVRSNHVRDVLGQVLYRSAEHNKDFRGGHNQYCDLDDLPTSLHKLLD